MRPRLGWETERHPRAQPPPAREPTWLASRSLAARQRPQSSAAGRAFGESRPDVEAAKTARAARTRVSVFAPDRPGLFYRICAALAPAGANIVDARIPSARVAPTGRAGRRRELRHTRRPAVVPDDEDVRRAVAVRQVHQPLPVRPAGDVVHPVAALELLPEGGAGRVDVDPLGHLKILGFCSMKGQSRPRGVVVVERPWQTFEPRAVVVGRPPDLVRPGLDGRAGERVAVRVGTCR